MSKKVWMKLIAVLAAVVLFVIIILQNAGQQPELTFLFWKGRFPLILLLVIVFALGLIAGIFTAFRVSAQKEKKK